MLASYEEPLGAQAGSPAGSPRLYKILRQSGTDEADLGPQILREIGAEGGCNVLREITERLGGRSYHSARKLESGGPIMLLRTVVAGYLGATLVVAGTGVSAYKLLQARHASVDALALMHPQADPLAMLSVPLPEGSPGRGGSFPIALPELRPPMATRGEHHASARRLQFAHRRAPIGVSLREPSHRRPVRTVAANEQPPRLHTAPRPIRYPVYYRVYYPYAYYGYYPGYPRY